MGRLPRKRKAAAVWLARQPWFAEWVIVPTYQGRRQEWKQIADAVRQAGLFSASTGTIDVPVQRIVAEAIVIRERMDRETALMLVEQANSEAS